MIKRLSDLLKTVESHPAFRIANTMRELIALAVFYFGILKNPLGKFELEASYSVSDLSSPMEAARVLDSLTHLDVRLADKVRGTLQSPQLMRVEVENKTSHPLSSLELQIVGVMNLTDVSVTTNSEHFKGREATVFKSRLSEDVLSFPFFDSLPPDTRVELLLWGRFAAVGFGDAVQVRSTAARPRVQKSQPIDGLRLVFAQNLGVLSLVTVAVLVLVSLRRLAGFRAKRSHGNV